MDWLKKAETAHAAAMKSDTEAARLMRLMEAQAAAMISFAHSLHEIQLALIFLVDKERNA